MIVIKITLATQTYLNKLIFKAIVQRYQPCQQAVKVIMSPSSSHNIESSSRQFHYRLLLLSLLLALDSQPMETKEGGKTVSTEKGTACLE